jgi:hypothetical protein
LSKSTPSTARRSLEGHSATTQSRTLDLLQSFPIYRRVLALAIAHEERGLHYSGYKGWRWDDVEVHPTRLIRLVTNGISRINFRTRKATYYLLKDRDEVKRALEKDPAETRSYTSQNPEALRRSNERTMKKEPEHVQLLALSSTTGRDSSQNTC